VLVDSAVNAGYAYRAVDGAGAYLNAEWGSFTVHAEYMAALETVALPSGGIRPVCCHVEVSLPLSERLAAGVKVEGSEDFFADYQQDKWADVQFGGVISWAVNDNLTMSGEYLRAEGLDENAARDQITVQAALVL